MALKEAGYNVGSDCNVAYDFMPILDELDKYIYKEDFNLSVFKRILQSESTPFSIKHGQLMFATDLLKDIYPDCKIILVIRHPIDAIINHFDWHLSYCKIFKKNLEIYNTFAARMHGWILAHNYAINSGNIDIVIKLEELCEKPLVERKNSRMLFFKKFRRPFLHFTRGFSHKLGQKS